MMRLTLTAGFVDDLAALDPDLCHMGLVLGVGGVGSLLHLLLGDAAEILGQDLLRHLMDEVLRTVDADVVVDELLALQLGAVSGQHLGVVGHDGAVVVVVAQPLVDVVGQAGVEDGIQMHLGQGLDVAVAELGRETGGVTGGWWPDRPDRDRGWTPGWCGRQSPALSRKRARRAAARTCSGSSGMPMEPRLPGTGL